MQTVFTVDMGEFRKAAQALLQTSSRSCVDFTNGQMLRVASNAIKFTQKANRSKIERQLGVVSSRIKARSGEAGKKGWVRITNRVLRKDSLAERILLAKFRKTGKWGIKGKDLAEKAMNLVKAKVRSVAFIKSGWIPAVRILSGIVYKKPQIERISLTNIKLGQDKGGCLPATKNLPTCTIANTALNTLGRFSTWHGKAGNPIPVAQDGLRAALNWSAKDMMAKLAERLKADLKPFGAK
jgi:hypothetical protein